MRVNGPIYNVHIIIDKKNKERKFLCEEIIKSPEFQEGKDYKKKGKDVFLLISYELKKRVLNRYNLSNNECPVVVSSSYNYEVIIDRGNYSEEFWKSIFPEDKKRPGGNNQDKDNKQNNGVSLTKPSAGLWLVGGITFTFFFLLLFIFIYQQKKK